MTSSRLAALVGITLLVLVGALVALRVRDASLASAQQDDDLYAPIPGVSQPDYAGVPSPALAAARQAGRTFGTPHTFRNLTLIPVHARSAKARGSYMTLDEGLHSGLVTVSEGAGDLERDVLLVTNNGSRPLFIPSGEGLIGGCQDRVVATDTLLPPGGRSVPIAVFCMEKGRSDGPASEFRVTAASLAAPHLRAAAQETQFMPDADCPPFADHPAKTQDVVWNEINKKNRSFDARPATEAYRAVLNLEEGNARERITPYAAALTARLERTPHPVVGVVAAVDGKVIAADIFGDSALFRKFWPKLLLSYAADAAERTSDEDGATPAAAATPEQAKAFLARGFNVTDSSRAGTMLRFESREAIAYRLTESGDGTRLVHESVVRK